MPKLQLFDYVVLYNYKIQKDNAGNDITPDSEVIVPAGQLLGRSQDAVAKKVTRMIPDKYEDELHLCEVIIRPF